jgi:hypothetical protein
MWRSDTDVPQLGVPLVVSKEYVAMQVMRVIQTWETWLESKGLSLNTVMSDPQIQEFLAHCKTRFHAQPEQLKRQKEDAANDLAVKTRKKSRWAREQQRLAGATQMWQILSFAGKWDPDFLAQLPPVQSTETTDESKAKTKAGNEARSKYREGMNLARLRTHMEDEERKGKGKGKDRLNKQQKKLLELYDNGTLLSEANRLTKLSGHGTLKSPDQTFLQIGGSTGGYFRSVIFDWTPPDASQFDEELDVE